MRTEFFRIITVLSACACAAGLSACADDLKLKAPDGQDNLMLVLQTGRIVQGELIPRPGGYDVVLPAGRMFVPSRQIRFTAHSMDDAYLGMRASIAEFTPDAHLSLARWCLNNRLTSRARSEILDALKLDPYRDDARRMLENLVREQQKVIQEDRNDEPEPTMIERRYADRRSLGGLPGDLAIQFTQRIQPLVIARCGDARCHSTAGRLSANRAFRLEPTLRRPTPAITEQNLAAVLRQIDLDHPANSPLLAAAHGLHGGNSRPTFSNRTGGRQRQILQEWVLATAEALGGARAGTPTLPIAAATAQTVSGRTENHSDASSKMTPASQTNFVDTDPSGTRRAGSEVETEFVRTAEAATRSDAFDPKIFNQRFHGRTNPHRTATPTASSLEDVR